LTINQVLDVAGNRAHYVVLGENLSDAKKAQAHQDAVNTARKVQQHLLPSESPHLPGFEIAACFHPAERVSGDYYDYLPAGEFARGILVADVSGHGLGPALLASHLQAYMGALELEQDAPGEFLTQINEEISVFFKPRYATLMLVTLDPRTQFLRYAGAGHIAVHFDRQGSATRLDSTGMPVGLMGDTVISTSEPVPFLSGELLLLCTDGIQETFNEAGEQFGWPRTMAVVKAHRDLPAEEIARALAQAARDFAGGAPPEDDVTVVIIKRLPNSVEQGEAG